MAQIYTVRQSSELMTFLMENVPGMNRTKAKQLLSKQMVSVDKVINTKFNAPLREGQRVEIARRGNEHSLRNPFVRIVYEDPHLVVVDKAEGILTNAPLDGRENSVKRILDQYFQRESRRLSAHTVHRLDRYTSGLMIFAKRRDVQQIFIDRWQELIADRRYVALVEGVMEKKQGTVASWLKDNKVFMTYSSPYDNGGKYAVTHYRTLETAPHCTLVECKLETGRKNQIRVHMQQLQHSVVGDLKYGATTDPSGRVCLHAYKLQFWHPVTHELLNFETPVPQKFLDVLSGRTNL